jgi:uncharacterized protein YcbK (DUF882 family)
MDRRTFLLYTASAAALASPVALANVPIAAERRLSFYNLHTGEKLVSTYWSQGEYIADELAAINHVLRDHRSGEVEKIDPNLLDLLHALQNKVEKSGEFHIISGYRSPKTNAMLRRDSAGVAKRSLHTRGKAVDIRLPGVALKHLRRAALDMHAGGVGYYPKSGFIHVDTGRPRFW